MLMKRFQDQNYRSDATRGEDVTTLNYSGLGTCSHFRAFAYKKLINPDKTVQSYSDVGDPENTHAWEELGYLQVISTSVLRDKRPVLDLISSYSFYTCLTAVFNIWHAYKSKNHCGLHLQMQLRTVEMNTEQLKV